MIRVKNMGWRYERDWSQLYVHEGQSMEEVGDGKNVPEGKEGKRWIYNSTTGESTKASSKLSIQGGFTFSLGNWNGPAILVSRK